LLLLFQFDLRTVAFFYLAVAILVAVVRAMVLRRQAPISVREVSVAMCWRLLKQLAPFGVPGLAMVIYLRIGDVLIVWLAPDGVEQLALFKMAHLPVTILIGLLAASVTPFYGNITKLGGAASSAPPAALRETLRTTGRYVLIIGGLLLFAPTVLAEPLVVVVCGAQWTPSAPLLKLMLWHAPLPALITIFGRSLQAVGKEWTVAAAAVAMLAVKVGLLTLLLPRYGAWGLAWATVLAAVLSLVVSGALAWPLLGPARRLGKLLATLGAFAVGAVIAYRGFLGHVVLDALLSYGIFAALLIASRAAGWRDVAALRNALRGA